MSQAYSSPRKRGLLGLVAVLGLISALCLLLLPGATGAAKGNDEATANVAKAKKKKKKPVRIMTQNLYLGTDLTPIITAANAGQVPSGNPLADAAAKAASGDNFLNEVGFGLNDVQTNDFSLRAQTISKEIKANKPDIVGLQEVALWKLEFPTDGGGPPTGTPATTPLIDYSDTLLNALNAKALTKKQCKKKGLKGSKCYRGYQQVTLQQEADVEQPGDLDNNPGPDGVGGTGPGFPPPCAGVPGTLAAGVAGFDDTGVSAGDPGPGPAAANLDYNGDFNGVTAPPTCNPNTSTFQADPPGTSDCGGGDQGDTNPFPVPPGTAPNTPTCFLNGIDGDVRLQMRDAIIVRKGAGVKTRNAQGGNYGAIVQLPVGSLGTAKFTRGWTSVQATVRGMSFHLINTHLESESIGTVREDQAAELVQPGAPGAVNKTVLIGDLNSDSSIEPVNLPNGDSSSNIAYNRLAAAGYKPLTGPANTDGHAEILNNPNDNSFTKRIDWILTNSPSITMRSSRVLNTFANGLWGSDHGGVLSILNVPGKK